MASYQKKAPAAITTKLTLKLEKADFRAPDSLGTPQRPMSARDALRSCERGKKLHPDTWVAPSVNWAKRLKMNPSAVPLFGERDRPKEDSAYTQVRKMMASAVRDDFELRRKREQEKSEEEEKRKSPKKHVPKVGTFSNLDTGEKERRKLQESAVAMERRMMEQARKLEHLFITMTSQGELMTSSEWASLLSIVKNIWMPMIEKRIYDLEEILLEMKSDAKVEIKEKGWGIRDYKSYEAELAKRRTTLAGLKVVSDGLFKRQVDLKSTTRMATISSKFVRNKFLMAGMKAANTAKLFKLMGKDNKSHHPPHQRDEHADGDLLITDKLFHKLSKGTEEEQIQSLEQLAIMGDEIASVFTEDFAREVILGCLCTHKTRIRNGAKVFVTKLFHKVPVLLVPEKKPGVNDETEVKRAYEQRRSDRAFLHQLWDRTVSSTAEIRQSTLQVLGDIIWPDDVEFMQKMAQQLDDTDAQIRVEAIKTLSRLTEGRGNMGIFNRICHMFTDPDWTVRTAVSYALPNVAGLYGAGLQAEKDRERAIHEQKQQHDRLRQLATGNAPKDMTSGRRGSVSQYGRRRGSVTTEMLEEKHRRKLGLDKISDSPSPRKQIRFQEEPITPRTLELPPDLMRTPSAINDGTHKKFLAGLHKVQGQVHTARSMRDKTLSLLEALTEDDSWNVRRSGLQMLAKIASCGNRSAINVMLERCEDENEHVRVAAFLCLPKIVTPKDVECLRVMAILLGYLDPLKNVKLVETGVVRWPQTTRRDFRKQAIAALVQIAGKGNVHAVEGLCDYALGSKDPEVRRAALEMMPSACLVGSENHHTAVEAAVKCISEKSDQVRQMAAQVLPQIIDEKTAANLQSVLVNLLSHDDAQVRRTAVAVIVAIAPSNTRTKRDTTREQLLMIAFNSGEAPSIENYDDQSLLDPLLGVEEELLQKFSSPDIIAQGLVWKLNSGATGMDASHWRRRLFLMTAQRKLSYVSMKDGHNGKSVTILDDQSLFTVTRMHFAQLVPYACKIEFEENLNFDRKDLVFGFFSKEELVVWVRDLAAVNRLNRMQRAQKKKEKEDKERSEAERLSLLDQKTTLGRTERILDEIEEEALKSREEAQAQTGPSQELVLLKERLGRLYADRALFSEYAGAGRGGGGADHSPLRGVVKNESPPAKGQGKHERLEMSNFMKLLRAHKIVGPGGVPGKVVIAAWRIANGLGAAGIVGGPGRVSSGAGDNDRLLLDWDEYQDCICLLAEKSGVPLSVSRKSTTRDREPLRVRKEVVETMTQHWNNHQLFHQFASLNREDMHHLHTVPGQHVVTMDYREFLGLMTHLKLHPDPFSKTVLGRIYKQTNAGDEGLDQFEFTFDEYKNAMMLLAREFEIPIFYNGRNIAQNSTFA